MHQLCESPAYETYMQSSVYWALMAGLMRTMQLVVALQNTPQIQS
jgi:hypothetical protein